MPKISVIMGVYNGEKYLHDAVLSILNQTFKDFELIICDDGSSDKSLEIINDFRKQDKRVVLLRNQRNIGLASSLNKCIEVAKGKYIARMDCDDLSLEDRFEKQVVFLENNPDIDIVGGQVNLFDGDGIYGVRKLEHSYNKINVFKRTFFIHPTVMMRREILISVGGYTVAPYTYRTEDYDLWCKLCEKGYKGYILNEILLNYREDKNAYSKKKFKYRIDSLRLRRKWYKKLNISIKYSPFIFKPIFAGLVPRLIMHRYHKWLSRKY
ncbi:glycosyltransferase [Virgibacillus halodenitrificans]|uniref:glycosyltransferase n=1 Tax=Virgibacillus halodenitrificans TaxID=1482 RepID=UPI002DB69D66|nr:glycosyltransferase [Virgibacillus halodenitrificans]MEC2159784.1 glycosyltransferase [Virgibacillus halodenitrificans]